jgi:predicted RNA-binding Zn ribbon-like protein
VSQRTVQSLDLVGGAPALDFANTINSRFAPTHDYLQRYLDVVAWSVHAGLATGDGAARLTALANQDPRASHAAWSEALVLRERIHRVFRAAALGTEAADDDVRALLAAYGTSVGRIVPRPDMAVEPMWEMAEGPAAVLDPISYSAGRLLLDPARPRIGQCPGCGWVFVDTSRNRSRRWCDMQTCGVRDKMRRYRSRTPR